MRQLIPSSSVDDVVPLDLPMGVMESWFERLTAMKSAFAHTRPAALCSDAASKPQLAMLLNISVYMYRIMCFRLQYPKRDYNHAVVARGTAVLEAKREQTGDAHPPAEPQRLSYSCTISSQCALIRDMPTEHCSCLV